MTYVGVVTFFIPFFYYSLGFWWHSYWVRLPGEAPFTDYLTWSNQLFFSCPPTATLRSTLEDCDRRQHRHWATRLRRDQEDTSSSLLSDQHYAFRIQRFWSRLSIEFEGRVCSATEQRFTGTWPPHGNHSYHEAHISSLSLLPSKTRLVLLIRYRTRTGGSAL